MTEISGGQRSVGIQNSEKKLVATSFSLRHCGKEIGKINLGRSNLSAVVYSRRDTVKVLRGKTIKPGGIGWRIMGRDGMTLVTNDWLLLRYEGITDGIRGINLIVSVSDPVNIRNVFDYDCILDGINSILGIESKDVTEKDIGIIADDTVRSCVNELLGVFSPDEVMTYQKRMQDVLLTILNEDVFLSHIGLKIISVQFDVDRSGRAPVMTRLQMEDLNARIDNYLAGPHAAEKRQVCGGSA